MDKFDQLITKIRNMQKLYPNMDIDSQTMDNILHYLELTVNPSINQISQLSQPLDFSSIEKIRIKHLLSQLENKPENHNKLDSMLYDPLFNRILNSAIFYRIEKDEKGQPKSYRFIHANEAFYQMTGNTREDIIGKTFIEVFPWAKKDSVDWIAVFSSVVIENTQKRMVQFSKELDRWFDLLLYSVDQDYLVCIFEDITEKKYHEESLVNLQIRYKKLIEYSPLGIALIQKDGSIFEANGMLYQLFGRIYVKEVLSIKVYDLMFPDSQIIKENLEKTFANGVTIVEETSLYDKQNKQIRFLKYIFTPIREEDGSIEMVQGIFEDITKTKKYEQSLTYRIEFEKIINDISRRFINLQVHDLDREIHYTLKSIGEFAGVDYCYLYIVSKDGQLITKRNEWIKPAISPDMKLTETMQVEDYPFSADKLFDLEIVYVKSRENLPLEAVSERKEMERLNIQSMLLVPMGYRGVSMGFLGFNSLEKQKEWNEEDIQLLKIAGDIITNAIQSKTHEEKLRNSEETARDILNAASEIEFLMDYHGNIITGNYTFMNKFNLNNEDIPGLNLRNIYPDTVLENFKQHSKLVVSNKKSVVFEETIEHSFFSIHIYPILNSDGEVENLAVFSRDVTEQKIAEKALKESEEQYRNLVERANDGIIVVMDEAVQFCNKRIADMLNDEVDNIIGTKFVDYLHPDELSKVLNNYEGRLKGQDVPKIYESILQKRDGSYINVEINAGLIPYKGKAANLVILRDITQRKLTENALKEALIKAQTSDTLKSAFLANMSHEIRTPLNAIIGFADLMLLNPQNYSENYDINLRKIKENGMLLLELINDILDLSKIEAGQIQIERVPCSLTNIIINSTTTAKAIVARKKKNIEIKRYISEEMEDLILCDPTRIQQILNNLISNAIKFTNHGFIEFGVYLTDINTMEFYVKDSGIGIPEDRIEQIFKPFQQADFSISRKYGGTGLGLTITKKLVEIMGGNIRLETRIREGTTVYFTLPYNPAKSSSDIQKKEAPLEYSPMDYNILLVEDNPVNQELTQQMLELFGYKVIIAKNGEEGIAIYKSNSRINLILMDIRMPNIDGIHATKIIRQIEKEENRIHIPILALTAAAMKEEITEVMQNEFEGCITKPVELQTLISSVKTYLK